MSQRDSFMQTSKGKLIKRILLPLLTLAFFLTGEYALGRLLTPVNSAVYFKDEIAELSDQGAEADLLFLGTSRVFHSFAPEIFEEELGLGCVINGGTGTQRPESSYMFLKDLDRQIKPKAVVLGVQWTSPLEFATDAQITESTLMVYDRMTAAGRLDCMVRKLGSPVWPELFPAYRYRYDLRFDTVKAGLAKWKDYRKNGFTPNTSADHYYCGKGFVYANHRCEQGNIPIMDEGIHSFSTDAVIEGNMKYIDAIADYCEKNDIRLYLAAPPMSLMNLYHIEGYQEAEEFLESYAEERGLIYHNLNYLKDREEFLGDDCMTDYVHLSGEGACRVSRLYAEILGKDMRGEDTSGYFYKDLDELKADVDRIVAVSAKISEEDGICSAKAESLHNDGVIPLYRFELSTDGGESFETVADWSESGSVSFEKPEGAYTLKVTAALSPEDPVPAWMEYDKE